MQIQFKNQHIFFALEEIWPVLNYKFKYQINTLITSNPDPEFVQTVDVPEDILVEIYRSVTAKPEGVAAGINHLMNLSLLEQIQPLANLGEVQQGAEPNEAARVLIAIDAINNQNVITLNAKITNGQTQILA